MTDKISEIKNYYHSKESRLGYKIILGGTKHFGYYPDNKRRISMRHAMRLMIDKLGDALDLPEGSKVLDAGCGEGATAIRLADKYKLNIKGIDLLDFNICSAKRKLAKINTRQPLEFEVGDYTKLKLPDNSIDAVYTMETLVHSPDYEAALQEFHRVLKKGGKIVLFEYSMPKESELTADQKKAYSDINIGSAMHSLPKFTHGSFPAILKKAGFGHIDVEDITVHIIPMLRKFWMLGVIPYQLIKLRGTERKYANATAGVELYKHRDTFRYNIITAIK